MIDRPPPLQGFRRAGIVVDVALALLAAGVTLTMLAAALHDVSQAWDSGYYHLPFAARLAGILPAEDFVFHPANAARFAGFPLLGERLQGLLWRATGRIECANLVAFSSVPLLAWFLRRRFAVPVALSILALLAIPLVQMHATSTYVDLPANTALTVLVLLAIEAHASPAAPVTRTTLALALLAAAVAANMKALLHPLVAVALVALFVRALPPLVRDLRGADSSGSRSRAWLTLGALAVALPIAFATPLANLAVHGNPYYPVRLSIAGHAFPGPEAAYDSSPPWLASAPRPFRFACSLLEVGIRPMTDERRWSVDQWMPDESGGNRMGGFFGVYVLLNLALLAGQALRDRSREARAAVVGFAVLTAVVSVMPQSHELRYYMGWMITLVSVNLWLAVRSGSRARLRSLGGVAAAVLVVVIGVTRADYVLPSGSGLAELVHAKVDDRIIAGIKDGERVCVRHEPWNLLWARELHPPRHYTVVEAEDPAECAGARPLE